MKKVFSIFGIIFVLLCGCSNSKIGESPEKLYKDFFDGKVPVYSINGYEIWKSDLLFDDNDWNCYRIGEQVDVDNDGENEQLIDGPAGGFFLDYRDNQLFVLPDLYEAVGDMTYYEKDGVCWIVYMDSLASGREYYRFLRYNGATKLEDIEIKKLEISDNKYDYYINSEIVSEDAFLEAKNKYLQKN